MNCLSPSSQSLVDQGQGLVRSLAARIHRKLPHGVDVQDLIGYGQVGLVEAARDFDASRGNQFSTYAYYRIRGAIYDGLSKMSWFGRTHYEHIRYERMVNDALTASAPESKPAEVGRDEAGVRSFLDMSWSLLVVYLASHLRPDEEGDGDSAGLTDPSTPTPLSEVVDSEISQQLRKQIDALPADEAALIRATYFEGATLEEAGRKIGISKSWASRLHAKSLQRLARSLRLAGLGS
jgi:RNA polymerase sigma factor for flagellar operon FliA